MLSNGFEEQPDNVVDAENLHGLQQKMAAVESVIFVAQQFQQLRHVFCKDNAVIVDEYFDQVTFSNEYFVYINFYYLFFFVNRL